MTARKTNKKYISIILALVMASIMVVPAFAGTIVWFTGQGFTQDLDGSWIINDERCGAEGQGVANDGGTGQFANWNGPGEPYMPGQPYLVWVLTANGATSAMLKGGPFGAGVAMFNVGGTFKYASAYYDPSDLIGIVYAEFEGRAKGKVQLVVSHGCRPHQEGAWCSPGFWRNARDGAWALVGKARTDLFDGFVYDYWFGNSLPGVTLITVLNNPQTYSGPPVPGTSGYQLNAFNATGAALTDLIPGYSFDFNLIGSSDACPVDNHGNLK